MAFAIGLLLRKRCAPIALAVLAGVLLSNDGIAGGIGAGLATGVILQFAVYLARPALPLK